jgi:hypothetical protein
MAEQQIISLIEPRGMEIRPDVVQIGAFCCHCSGTRYDVEVCERDEVFWVDITHVAPPARGLSCPSISVQNGDAALDRLIIALQQARDTIAEKKYERKMATADDRDSDFEVLRFEDRRQHEAKLRAL